jgi:hypothetical protein
MLTLISNVTKLPPFRRRLTPEPLHPRILERESSLQTDLHTR